MWRVHSSRIVRVARSYSSKSKKARSAEIESLFESASWSTKNMLSRSGSVQSVTSGQLEHLLKLSALPLPKSSKDQMDILEDLTEQLHFVKKVQEIDTSGVQPLKNLTAEQDESDVLKYEDAVEEGKQSQENSAAPKVDYTKLAHKTKNKYYTVDGGLLVDELLDPHKNNDSK